MIFNLIAALIAGTAALFSFHAAGYTGSRACLVWGFICALLAVVNLFIFTMAVTA